MLETIFGIIGGTLIGLGILIILDRLERRNHD